MRREEEQEEQEQRPKSRFTRNVLSDVGRGIGHMIPKGIRPLDSIVDPRSRPLYGAKLDANKLFGIRKDAALIRPDTPLYKKKKGKNPYKDSMARMRRLLR